MRALKLINTKLTEKNARLLHLMISGSTLYGFPSLNSDIDYRGSYVVSTSKLLGLSKPKDVIEIIQDRNDIVLFEIEKTLNLALKGNCNVLEQIYAKQEYLTPEFRCLRKLLPLSKKGLYMSYRGIANFVFYSNKSKTVKRYLYAFRSLLAGIHVLEEGKIEPNILVLNSKFKIPEIDLLIDLRLKNGIKNTKFTPKQREKIEEKIALLFKDLDSAYSSSSLPEVPSEQKIVKIEEWLIKLRKENWKG